MLSRLDAEKLLEFFRKKSNLEELIRIGITETQEDGSILSSDHVLGFFPNGCTSGLKQLYDSKREGWVEFDVYKLDLLLETAKKFGASTVKVSTDAGAPLFIKTEYGVFAIAPMFPPQKD